MRRRHGRRARDGEAGLTLIEVLVVLAIVAVTIPELRRYRTDG